MLPCTCKQAAWTVAALALLQVVSALPQAPSSSSSSSSARSSSSSSQRSRSSTSSRTGTPTSIDVPDANPTDYPDNSDVPISAPVDPDIPDYAITYAPIIYLHTNESYWPSSLDVHLSKYYAILQRSKRFSVLIGFLYQTIQHLGWTTHL